MVRIIKNEQLWAISQLVDIILTTIAGINSTWWIMIRISDLRIICAIGVFNIERLIILLTWQTCVLLVLRTFDVMAILMAKVDFSSLRSFLQRNIKKMPKSYSKVIWTICRNLLNLLVNIHVRHWPNSEVV